MARDRRHGNGEKVLDVDASMQGSLCFKDPVNLRINGKFEGVLETRGTLAVTETAVVNARIIGDNIEISGHVKGEILAREQLSLIAPAVVEGTIKASRLSVSVGAKFEGSCHMLEDVLGAEDLAKYLEMDMDSIVDWADSGKVPAFKDGDEWRFERSKIDEWIASGAIK